MTLKSPILKRLGWFVFWVLFIHFIIELSGHHYLYNTLSKTVFEGRLGPGIQEYKGMPNNTIRIGNPQSWPLHSSYNEIALTSAEESYHSDFETVSFIVVKDDSILHEQYWEHFGDAELSNTFSIAKSMVSLLTGIAIGRGEIKSVDTPVYHYLPQYEKGLGKQLNIEHLLTMSSGIDFDEHYLNPFAFPAKANYGDDLELLLSKYEVTEIPGETWSYQSGTTQVLAFVLKSATRSSLSNYASEYVWQKIGAEQDALWSLDHEGGAEKAFCCINATAKDLARLGKLYLHNGNWEGEQIVDSAYIAASIAPANLKNPDGSPTTIYGYLWWLGEDDGVSFYFARGIKGQYIIVIPERDLVVVRMGHKRDDLSGREHPNDVYQYLRMGLRIAGNEK